MLLFEGDQSAAMCGERGGKKHTQKKHHEKPDAMVAERQRVF